MKKREDPMPCPQDDQTGIQVFRHRLNQLGLLSQPVVAGSDLDMEGPMARRSSRASMITGKAQHLAAPTVRKTRVNHECLQRKPVGLLATKDVNSDSTGATTVQLMAETMRPMSQVVVTNGMVVTKTEMMIAATMTKR